MLVVAFSSSGTANRGDLAALAFGLQIAEASGEPCDLLVLGEGAESAAETFAKHGPGRVLVARHADLAQPTGEAVARAIVHVAQGQGHQRIAAANSTQARDSLPRVAARLGAAMASDVVALRGATAEQLALTKPCFSGNLLAEVELVGPAVVTCRASSFEAPPAADRAAPISPAELPERLAHARKRRLEFNKTPLARPELTEADIVVVGGRGTKGAEGFAVLEELADQLGAAIGASRAAVDAGWMPNDFQVGQTGKVIAPKLYIGCGVSGAIQHLAGMRNSRTIVAINKDPQAPLLEIADLALVADLFDAVPRLAKALRE